MSCVDELLALLLRPVRVYLATTREAVIVDALGRFECEVIHGDNELTAADVAIVDANYPGVKALLVKAAQLAIPVVVLIGAFDDVSTLAKSAMFGVMAYPVTPADIDRLFRTLKIKARERPVPPAPTRVDLAPQLSG